MVVRDRTGRKRYILFVVRSPKEVSREMIGILNRAVSDHSRKGGGSLHPWLTVYNGKWGIVRCPHMEKTEVISLMTSMGSDIGGLDRVEISTVRTSGSIRKLGRLLDRIYSKGPAKGP